MPTLLVDNLSFAYPGRPAVLTHVNLRVEDGEAVAIIGSSGAGKSTLFRAIVGLSAPLGGRVLLGEYDVTQHPAQLRGAIGYVHQQHGLPLGLSAETAVLTGTMHSWSALRVLASPLVGHSAADAQRAAEVLACVGLEGRGADRISELSVGQRQRVAVARTLLQQPQLLVADEPVASVDPATADVVLDLLAAEARRGAAVLCSVHDPDKARTHFGRIVALADGRVVFDARREDLTDAIIASIYAGEAS